MTNQIVKIEPKEYGLTSETASQIEAQFKPMLEKMTELEKEFNEVVSLPIDSLDAQKRAKELRLKYVKVRTGTAAIHKEQKDFYLKGGRFVDGWKNAQLFASQSKEDALEKIEKYAEEQERIRLEAIETQRRDLIREYVEDVTILNLSAMADDVWDAYFNAKKQAYFDRIEAEKEAERLRIEAENKQRLHNERKEIALPYYQYWSDFEKTLNFGEQSESDFNNFIERIKNAKAQADRIAEEQRIENERLKKEKEEADKRAKELEEENARKLKAIQEEADKKAAEEKAKQDAILEAERNEKERIAKELQDKKDAEIAAQKAEAERIEKEKKEAEKLAKAPIKKQLSVWVDSFELPKTEINHLTAVQIQEKFAAFQKWAKEQIENI